MANEKFTDLPAVTVPSLTDIFCVVQGGPSGTSKQETGTQFASLLGFTAGILAPANGGTGVANTGTFTVGGNTSFIGAYTFAGTLTGNTAVTFPTSGTLATTQQATQYQVISATTLAMVVNTKYLITAGTTCTMTLPATSSAGDVIVVAGAGGASAGWSLTQNAGQSIEWGSLTTTVGASGHISSTDNSDGFTIVCVTANTFWALSQPQGNMTII